MKLSVITCTYNRAQQLNWGIRSLARQKVMEGNEIIVVDDGSVDDTVKVVADIIHDYPHITWQYIHINKTESRVASIPRNIGLKMSHGEEIIYTESECLHVGDTIQQLLDNRVKYPNDLVLASHVYIMGERIYKDLSDEYYKDPIKMMSHPYCQEVSGFFENTKAPDSDWAISGEMECNAGILFMVKKEWLMEIGGFDESFVGQGFEDFDLYARLNLRGHAFQHCSDIRIIHQWHDKSFYKFDIFEAGKKNGMISLDNVSKGIYIVNQGKEWGQP